MVVTSILFKLDFLFENLSVIVWQGSVFFESFWWASSMGNWVENWQSIDGFVLGSFKLSYFPSIKNWTGGKNCQISPQLNSKKKTAKINHPINGHSHHHHLINSFSLIQYRCLLFTDLLSRKPQNRIVENEGQKVDDKF
jgi:hypothetical protein